MAWTCIDLATDPTARARLMVGRTWLQVRPIGFF